MTCKVPSAHRFAGAFLMVTLTHGATIAQVWPKDHCPTAGTQPPCMNAIEPHRLVR